jgi:hypothetical protein
MRMRTDYKIGLIISIGSCLAYTYYSICYLFFDFNEVKLCANKNLLTLMIIGVGMCGGSLRSEVNELKEENKTLKNILEESNNE